MIISLDNKTDLQTLGSNVCYRLLKSTKHEHFILVDVSQSAGIAMICYTQEDRI